MPSYFDQSGFRLRFARGRRGAREAAARGDVLVVVDVLSFASVVATAAAHGVAVVPCRPGDEAATAGAHPGCAIAGKRGEAGYSLSPLTFVDARAGEVVVVGSPNGAACAAAAASGARAVLAGSLLNATAVARAAAGLGEAVTVLACGERWADPDDDGEARPALEDDLGAGAILAALGPEGASPEAAAVAAMFEAVRPAVAPLVWDCGSGRELRGRGWEADVRHAARLDVYDVAPRLVDGAFLSPPGRGPA